MSYVLRYGITKLFEIYLRSTLCVCMCVGYVICNTNRNDVEETRKESYKATTFLRGGGGKKTAEISEKEVSKHTSVSITLEYELYESHYIPLRH